MEWFSQNWVWLLFAIGMVAMHIFGHGDHGGHDGNNDDNRPTGKNTAPPASKKGSGHRH